MALANWSRDVLPADPPSLAPTAQRKQDSRCSSMRRVEMGPTLQDLRAANRYESRDLDERSSIRTACSHRALRTFSAASSELDLASTGVGSDRTRTDQGLRSSDREASHHDGVTPTRF